MAWIDKTYVDNYKDYKRLYDWCASVGTVTDDYGTRINPLWYINIWEEKNFEGKKDNGLGGLPVWNTPEYFDVWLIRNCPIDFVQNRLKEQYGGGWSKTALTDRQEESEYQLIKEHKAKCDLYQRNGLGKNAVMSVEWKYNYRFKNSGMWWWIEVLDTNKGDMWCYNDYTDYWVNKGQGEMKPWNTNICDRIHGPLSMKRVLRMIRKWNLPEGTHVRFEATYKRYVIKEFVVTVKKKKSKK